VKRPSAKSAVDARPAVLFFTAPGKFLARRRCKLKWCLARPGRGVACAMKLWMAMQDEANEVRVKFFQDVIRTVVREVGAPVLEDALCGAVHGRVASSGDALPQQLPGDLWTVESGITGPGARDQGSSDRVAKARPNWTVRTSWRARSVGRAASPPAWSSCTFIKFRILNWHRLQVAQCDGGRRCGENRDKTLSRCCRHCYMRG
jgi:hypothetical protein